MPARTGRSTSTVPPPDHLEALTDHARIRVRDVPERNG